MNKNPNIIDVYRGYDIFDSAETNPGRKTKTVYVVLIDNGRLSVGKSIRYVADAIEERNNAVKKLKKYIDSELKRLYK